MEDSMSETSQEAPRRRPYQSPTVQVVLADPVTELLQGTGTCGTINDGCGQPNQPPLC
jgi:hypothetical protein